MDIIVYEYVKVWRKSYIVTNTDNVEEIKDKWDEGDYYDTEYLYETEELIEPKEGETTLEIYDETGDNLLYSNKNETN